MGVGSGAGLAPRLICFTLSLLKNSRETSCNLCNTNNIQHLQDGNTFLTRFVTAQATYMQFVILN